MDEGRSCKGAPFSVTAFECIARAVESRWFAVSCSAWPPAAAEAASTAAGAGVEAAAAAAAAVAAAAETAAVTAAGPNQAPHIGSSNNSFCAVPSSAAALLQLQQQTFQGAKPTHAENRGAGMGLQQQQQQQQQQNTTKDEEARRPSSSGSAAALLQLQQQTFQGARPTHTENLGAGMGLQQQQQQNTTKDEEARRPSKQPAEPVLYPSSAVEGLKAGKDFSLLRGVWGGLFFDRVSLFSPRVLALLGAPQTLISSFSLGCAAVLGAWLLHAAVVAFRNKLNLSDRAALQLTLGLASLTLCLALVWMNLFLGYYAGDGRRLPHAAPKLHAAGLLQGKEQLEDSSAAATAAAAAAAAAAAVAADDQALGNQQAGAAACSATTVAAATTSLDTRHAAAGRECNGLHELLGVCVFITTLLLTVSGAVAYSLADLPPGL
ncbi:uncharacterized protein EMH_0037520 [Eimeria mitis]|uniref:Uncharacterized protein n=1 Tax=Eimeria mitis TaxID=44415 RepID=U6JX16_9EIME|nr:uncharacterized protein EMH_0037520 [Eimeria mitis]CDJ28063.1 hypothetical protein EMH_0037520 [Eimeria mitis]